MRIRNLSRVVSHVLDSVFNTCMPCMPLSEFWKYVDKRPSQFLMRFSKVGLFQPITFNGTSSLPVPVQYLHRLNIAERAAIKAVFLELAATHSLPLRLIHAHRKKLATRRVQTLGLSATPFSQLSLIAKRYLRARPDSLLDLLLRHMPVHFIGIQVGNGESQTLKNFHQYGPAFVLNGLTNFPGLRKAHKYDFKMRFLTSGYTRDALSANRFIVVPAICLGHQRKIDRVFVSALPFGNMKSFFSGFAKAGYTEQQFLAADLDTIRRIEPHLAATPGVQSPVFPKALLELFTVVPGYLVPKKEIGLALSRGDKYELQSAHCALTGYNHKLNLLCEETLTNESRFRDLMSYLYGQGARARLTPRVLSNRGPYAAQLMKRLEALMLNFPFSSQHRLILVNPELRRVSDKSCHKALEDKHIKANTLRFPIYDTPVISCTEDVRKYCEFVDNALKSRRKNINRILKSQERQVEEAKIKEKLEQAKKEKVESAEAQADLANILSEIDQTQALSYAETPTILTEHEREVLAQLGLIEVTTDLNSYKKVTSAVARELSKGNRSFEKYLNILKRKTRPYDPTKPLSNKNPKYEELTDKSQILSLFSTIREAKLFGYDIETTSLSPLTGGQILTHQVSIAPYTAFLIRERVFFENPELKQAFSEILTSPDILKIIQNVKFESIFLNYHWKIEIANYFDTLIAAQCIDETRPIGLKSLAEQEFQVDMIEFDEITRGQMLFDPDSSYALEYACADADLALQLYIKYKPTIDAGGTPDELAKCPGAQYTREFYEIEMPLVQVIARMEQQGILVNPGLLAKMREEATADIAAIKQRIIAYVGEDFNPDSSDQLSQVLYSRFSLPILEYTKGGKDKNQVPSTGIPALESIKHLIKTTGQFSQHTAFIDDLIAYSHLQQLLCLYLVPFPRLINRLTGRIHTQINQCGAVTGRFSSENPNLQNLRRNQDD